MRPEFSIIIPVYNVAPYLRECLDSVLAQTVTNWEAICVDDGSTDYSSVILDEYAAKDSRFRVFHQNNAGVGAARNLAMSEATGEWLLFLDAYDILLDGALSKLSGKAMCSFDAIFFTGVQEFNSSQSIPRAGGSGRIIFEEHKAVDGHKILFHKPYIRGYSPLRILRTKIFRDVRYPEKWPMMEDSIHLMDVLRQKCRWAILDLVFYGYRHRDESASRQIPVERPMQVMRSINRSLSMAKDYFGFTKAELAEVAGRFDSALKYFLNVAFSNPTRFDMNGLISQFDEFKELTGRLSLNGPLGVKMAMFRVVRRPFGFGVIDIISRVVYGLRRRVKRVSK